MNRNRLIPRLHAFAGILAFAIIAAFLIASAAVELGGTRQAVASVKTTVAWALTILVPALMATGLTGFLMAGARPRGRAGIKLARMRVVAANGLLVLVPSAIFLALKAGAGEFDAIFATVQGVEFFAGGVNLVLMGLNIRDGLAITDRLGRSHSARCVG
ncbi:hypothetical protein [Nitratireductor luteus]|uniref:hypothetical protein n=1 Tax=Nitratireductor luteus TaxID=2976980 RepID=UPI00223EFD1A|nr:hypothetical protein [Nitratireductor luteus]